MMHKSKYNLYKMGIAQIQLLKSNPNFHYPRMRIPKAAFLRSITVNMKVLISQIVHFLQEFLAGQIKLKVFTGNIKICDISFL